MGKRKVWGKAFDRLSEMGEAEAKWKGEREKAGKTELYRSIHGHTLRREADRAYIRSCTCARCYVRCTEYADFS